jgi:hypothetical protein
LADWSVEENRATVADYFAMLQAELRGDSYNKSALRRRLQAALNNRSEPAIELKRRNISAALKEMGCPWIVGYKPADHFQRALVPIIVDYLTRASFRATAEAFVAAPVVVDPISTDILSALVSPPRPSRKKHAVRERREAEPPRVDYLLREQMNSELGLAGERWVLHFERARLERAGKSKLARSIEHVSRERSDCLGYDIHSFEENGAHRLIEVKTTKLQKTTPFYATRNEVDVSVSEAPVYHLYRVFDFWKKPQVFVLSGSLRETCDLDPTTFRASAA